MRLSDLMSVEIHMLFSPQLSVLAVRMSIPSRLHLSSQQNSMSVVMLGGQTANNSTYAIGLRAAR